MRVMRQRSCGMSYGVANEACAAAILHGIIQEACDTVMLPQDTSFDFHCRDNEHWLLGEEVAASTEGYSALVRCQPSVQKRTLQVHLQHAALQHVPLSVHGIHLHEDGN